MPYREAPLDRRCPACHKQLLLKLNRRLEVEECPDCGGSWVALAMLRRLIEGEIEARAPLGEADPEGVESIGLRACPECNTPMRRFRYGGQAFQVDACSLHGLWLDAGELVLLLDYLASLGPLNLPRGRVGDLVALRGPRRPEPLSERPLDADKTRGGANGRPDDRDDGG